MSPDRFQRACDLFHRSCELDADQRKTFLDQACGADRALRAEVESLLAEDSTAAALGRCTPPSPGRQLLRGRAESSTPIPAQIGRYPVVGKLGQGGMGVVYRARDTRLGRKVAINVLPEAFVADAERVSRFEREARMLASLSHPHIAAVFGLEEAGDTRFLVLELIERQTLAQRLARGRLPIDEALEIARQIAEAVEAAHERGVIHRDLKPGNIKIAPDEKVKVLDFGIAKALRRDGRVPDAAATETLPGALTGEGMALGTPGYRCPEQFRGKPVDKRADVFSFGCILCECLTGQKCFTGDTPADAIAAALERDPDWSLLPERTPPRVRDLLEECLEKDPQRRLHDIADARLTLERAIERREWTTGGQMCAMSAIRPRRLRAAAPWLVAGAMSLLAGAAL